MLNQAILIGRLGKDPMEVNTTSGISCTIFSVATNEKFNDSNGETKEKTEWHQVVSWGKAAEFVSQYLKKGRLVNVVGKLKTKSWDDDTGIKRYRTEIHSNCIKALDFSANDNEENTEDSKEFNNNNFVEDNPQADVPF